MGSVNIVFLYFFVISKSYLPRREPQCEFQLPIFLYHYFSNEFTLSALCARKSKYSGISASPLYPQFQTLNPPNISPFQASVMSWKMGSLLRNILNIFHHCSLYTPTSAVSTINSHSDARQDDRDNYQAGILMPPIRFLKVNNVG